MTNAGVDNETVHWNGQEYVLEALDGLYDECVIDEDDEDYELGRERTDMYFGPR